jgi:drug/metabolite transporter (DMT)-like permease
LKRAIFGFLAIISTIISINLMPAETAGCVLFSIGIVTAIMAYSFAYEDLTIIEIIAILGSFAGCIILNNPSGDFRNHCWGCAAAVLYTIFGAMNLLEIKDLSQQVHSSVITFYFGVLSTIITSVYYLCCEPSLKMVHNLPTLAAIGVFAWMI